MNKILAIFVLFLMRFAAYPAQAGMINLLYPPDGAQISAASGTFVFGNIFPSTAALSINSAPVPVYKNGAFLAYLPVSPGDFFFTCELKEDSAVTIIARKIKVADKRPFPVSSEPFIETESLQPNAPLELAPGDWLRVYAKGTPGMKAEFSASGLKKHLPMHENPPDSGMYSGALQMLPEDEAENSEITVTFSTASAKAKARAAGTVSATGGRFQVVETSSENVAARTGPYNGYMLFLPQGTRMLADGKNGRRVRLRLSNSESSWADAAQIKFLPEGTPPPQAVIGTINTSAGVETSSVSIAVSEQVPFSVETSENSLAVTFYYAYGHTNWIVYDSSEVFIESARWKQTADQTCRIEINLREGKKLWGYDARYADKKFIISLAHPPKIERTWPLPLKGLRVVIDPGHSPKKTAPYDGAIGPMGTLEADVNLAVSKVLAPVLESLGAKVISTRMGGEEVPLSDRPKIARDSGGHIFISLHNNALPDGENPFSVPRGFSTYYYHPHSMGLASAVHKSCIKNIRLPDEGLRYGDYLVARITQMPSILTESAYMIFPEQEELLNTASFREKLAWAVTEGILDFFGVERKNPAPSAQKKSSMAAEPFYKAPDKLNPPANAKPASFGYSKQAHRSNGEVRGKRNSKTKQKSKRLNHERTKIKKTP